MDNSGTHRYMELDSRTSVWLNILMDSRYVASTRTQEAEITDK